MLVRDKVGEKILEAIENVKDSEVEVVSLDNNEDFLKAIFSKLKGELEILELTKSIDTLAEIIELIDWIQICFGTTHLDKVIENRKDKLGLYWQRYYIKNKSGIKE